MSPRFATNIVLCIVSLVSGCATPPGISEGDEIPCVPHESRCLGDDAMRSCAPDGLSWERVGCGPEESCLSPLAGGRCERQPRNTRTLEQNFDAVYRLSLPTGGSCTAFAVAENVLLTNAHCCPESATCLGAVVEPEVRGNTTFEEDASSRALSVAELVAVDLSLDVAVIRTNPKDGWSAMTTVVLGGGPGGVGSDVYVMGHPRGRPLEASLGRIYAFRDSIEFAYASGVVRRKESQIIYGARAEPGSSGSPVFSATTHALVGIHHSGGLTPVSVGLDLAEADGFASLLAATDADAIAGALTDLGIAVERLESESDEP